MSLPTEIYITYRLLCTNSIHSSKNWLLLEQEENTACTHITQHKDRAKKLHNISTTHRETTYKWLFKKHKIGYIYSLWSKHSHPTWHTSGRTYLLQECQTRECTCTRSPVHMTMTNALHNTLHVQGSNIHRSWLTLKPGSALSWTERMWVILFSTSAVVLSAQKKKGRELHY